MTGVRRRTGRWPTCQKLQRSEPNGRVTWLAHRTVSGGAPDCLVRHATATFTNGYFSGWGYKYPQPPTIHCIQVFSLQTSYKSYSIQYKTQNKEIKSSPKSGITPNQIVTRESDICVHLSSCAWIASFLILSCDQLNCNRGKSHQLCGDPCGDFVSRLIEKRSSLGLSDRLREGKG